MKDLLENLLSGRLLSDGDTDAVFQAMLGGQLSEAQTGAFLAGWRAQGEGSRELFAGATALRRHAAKVQLPASVRPLSDNCGTGGDGSGSFNVSTAAAIVASSAGVKVAKHGNRSVSSKCGSADLLFAAGLPAALTPDAAGRLLERTGFTFFYAPDYHPVLKSVGPARKALGVRTIFNLLGPLANPIAPEFQVIGVGASRYAKPMAETLARLGIKRALVVHSRDGLDEISPAAPTDGFLVEGAVVKPYTVEPAGLGVAGTLADLAGGDAAFNLALLRRLLAGERLGLLDAVALNAGAVLWVAGAAPDLAAGLATARRQLSSGAAKAHFERWLSEAGKS